jgi:GNAT superfamily N-acetyltransferase
MITVKPAKKRDISAIKKLAEIIWPPTFSFILTTNQIQYMLNWMYSDESLTRQMEDGCVFFLAYMDDQPIGFASWQKVSDKEGKLHKLYVLPEMQGKKAGSTLLQTVIHYSVDQKILVLILNVNRFNRKAIDFYLRTGFSIVKEEDIDIGGGYYMNDYVMQKQLQ